MNCSARMVLPLPGRPMIMLRALAGSPPPRTASKRSLPLRKRSLIWGVGLVAREGAAAQQVLHGRDELQRLERLLEKRIRARGECFLAQIQARDTQQRRPASRFQPF